MALSNWLTRQEWNACFFLGRVEILEGRIPDLITLSTQLRAGIAVLHRAGYKFTGIDVVDDGSDFERREQCCTGNESVLADMITGNFHDLARAKEVLPWLQEHAPQVDIDRIRDGIAEAEQAQKAQL